LVKVEELSKKMGLKDLYIKDDGYSEDAKILTGNKMRKLEFLLAEAKKKGYRTVCTVGSAGSNHALETAICAKKTGLNAVLVLDDQRQTSVVIRNLKLMIYFDAAVIYAPPCFDTNEKLEQHAQEICTKNGYYFIPVGGSNELGSIGYVNAVFELKKQMEEMGIKEPDVIYITLGSTGTAAGVLAGANAAGLKSKIIPVRISYTPEYKTKFLCDLVNKTGKYLKEVDETFDFAEAQLRQGGIQLVIPGINIEINHDCVGGGYAAVTPKAADAISLLYHATGNKLEATYTGKTLSALIDDADNGILKGKTILFWNTFSYGAFEEFTSQVSDEQLRKNLPLEFIHYLTYQLQPNDPGI
jgi:D-cysteine desulfhydrase